MPSIEHVQRSFDLTPAELYKKSKNRVARGYPDPEHRWRPRIEAWREMVASGRIELPEGEQYSCYVDLPSRYTPQEGKVTDAIITPDNPATEAQLRKWRSQSALQTSLGLPLHPLIEIAMTTVLEDGRTLGMFTGPGSHWQYGLQSVSNLGWRRIRDGEAEYLTVTKEGAPDRSGNPTLYHSLPGGHHEGGSDAYDTAMNEGYEETSAPRELLIGYSGLLISTVPSLFGPNTAVAYLAEDYLMLDAGEDPAALDFVPEIRDTEEGIIRAGWMSFAEARANDQFSSSHLRQMEFFEAKLGA